MNAGIPLGTLDPSRERRRGDLSPMQRRAVDLLAGGYTRDQIGVEIGRPPEHVRSLLYEARRRLAAGGVEIPAALAAELERDPTRSEQAADLIRAGRTIQEIAEEWGVTQGAVRNYVIQARADGLLPPANAEGRPYGLTRRELEVLRGIHACKLYKQIGRELGISEKTVKVYVMRLKDKLEIRGQASRRLALFYERHRAELEGEE